MSAWGAQKRNIDDLVAGVESGRLACVVVLAGRVFDDAAAVKLAAAMRSPTCKLKELRCSGHSISAAGAAALGRAANRSVVVASIGELTNLRDALAALPELFAQKVRAIYYMDGPYNFGCGDSAGSGWSPWLGSTEDCDGAAQDVIARVPATIKQVFSGEGGDICTGGRFNEGCGDGPVKEAYQIWTDGGCRWSPW